MATAQTNHDVFHEGEGTVQERADAAAQGRNSGRLIADTIIPGAVKFVKKQPFVVTGSVDREQNLWASVLVGSTGFMTAMPRTVDINLGETHRADDDPLWRNLSNNSRIGMLVIDLRSRARLRVNGRVAFPSADQLHIDVDEAYPNCPQYIQRRIYRPSIGSDTPTTVRRDRATLDPDQEAWITRADTLFVASQHPSRGVDASHRGGNPGFVQVIDASRLRIPDYAGNGMFNTLGNFAVNPRAGLVFPDFENGRTLQLTGRTKILWDMDDPENQSGGTGRFWDFTIDRVVQIDDSLPGSSEFLDYSPHNPVSAS